MRILVTIKQVPETTEVQLDPENHTLKRDSVAAIINPFDLYAIEEALRIKEQKDEVTVTVLTMGPPSAEHSLKEAIAMGADEAVLVSDRAFAGADTWATSYTLAKAIETFDNYDLIITGKQAFDGDTAQVPPEMSEFLNIPFVGFVRKVEEMGEKTITVESMTEEGYNRIEMDLPGIISVVKEINTPRLPSLRGKMRAKRAKIEVLSSENMDVEPANLGLNGSPTRVVEVFTPVYDTNSVAVEGEPNEQAAVIFSKLKEGNLI